MYLELVSRFRHRLRLHAGVNVVVVSKTPPTPSECGHLQRHAVLCSPENTAVYVQQAVCSNAVSIAYVDDMAIQVGMGGGLTTIYEVIKEMGRNTSMDVGMSELLYSSAGT